MAGQTVYITEQEWISIQEASDFIGSNADGADAFERYEKLQKDLTNVFKKYKKRRDRQTKRQHEF